MSYQVIRHSAKGSTWEDHKYIKRIDGTYYYPDDYKGGRHLSDAEGKSNFSEYTKDDPDFDDKNYSKKNRLGDTEFYGFKRDDGTSVIVEEDMKWVLPKGTEITPDLIKRLESFDLAMEEKRNSGKNYTTADWQKWAKEAIDGSGTEGEKDIEGLANEVIRGNFGDGGKRKELLGNAYQEVQDRVNEILKGQKSSTTTKSSEKKEEKTNSIEKEDKKKNNRKKLINNKKKSDIKSYYGNYEPSYKVKHSDEIYHYGVPRRSGRYPWGSGDRPYQALGGGKKKKASYDDISDDEMKKVVKRKKLEDQYRRATEDPDEKETAKRVLNDTAYALNTVNNNIDDGSRNREMKWERMDLNNMTDQELRDAINRENLEIQYSKLFNSSEPEVKKGKQFVKNLFKTGVAAITVTASVLDILIAIDTLKKG